MKIQYRDDPLLNTFRSQDSLFHFTRKDVAIEHILYDSEIRLGRFEDTNDPKEYKESNPSGGGFELTKDDIRKGFEVSHLISDMRLASGFISFCKNRYDNQILIEDGCTKSRMWSQYGESHSGICLVFSKEKLLRRIRETNGANLQFLDGDVEYIDSDVDRRSWSVQLDHDELNSRQVKELAITHLKKHQDIFFFSKQLDYKDENEFQVVYLNLNLDQNNILIDIEGVLTGIILGDRFHQAYLPAIETITKRLKIPYRRLFWEKSFYTLLT